MENDIAVEVNEVSKTFKLPHEKQSSIKGALINRFKGGKHSYERQQVLKDVSFEIKKGEFFGIVGRNGSGKSTMLKILAGIYMPTKGHVSIHGKLTPFIELGVGFNPELTGRENVFLNGALLGFNRKEMATMYDDIVEFAEIERFMDQKLKNYSSGMQVRLAFSIAIRARSDILVLDEVLAVGDEAFQQKCIDVFEKYKAERQTVILVTHDMSIVRRFCSKALLLNNGEIVSIGQPEAIAREYSKMNDQATEASISHSNTIAQKDGINLEIFDQQRKARTSFITGETIKIEMSWPSTLEGVKNAGIGLVKQSGEFIFGANTFTNHRSLNDKTHLEYKLKLDVGPGKYYVMAGLFGGEQSQIIKYLDRGPEFIIKTQQGDQSQGLVRLNHDWKI